VWGTIMRGGGVCGRDGAIGVAVFVATGAAGCAGATGGVVTAVGAAACAAGGVAGVGWTGCADAGGATSGTCDWATGGAGTENVGLGVDCGTIILGGGSGAEGGGGAFTVETGGAAGEALAGGRAAGATALTGACCLRMAFSTSPGLEMLERSILVLISSLSARLGRDCFVDVCASLAARK